jgi:hypothetical protein
MKSDRPGRPKGSRNRKPSKREIASYIDLLRDAAQGGDVQAAATLVQIHTAEQLSLKEPDHA